MKKNLKYWILLAGLFAAFNSLYPAVPKGYYDPVNGKMDQELKTKLHTILKKHTKLNYNDLWRYFNTTDVRGNGTVWDMYSDSTFLFNGDKAIAGINREHSFPKSWWGTSDDAPKYAAYSDLNHLYPSEAKANGAKSNNILGIAGGVLNFNNGVSKVGMNVFNHSGAPAVKCFEPADEYKGDFARTYMYMVTCYEDYAAQWRTESLEMIDNNTYPVFQDWSKEMLLEWHRGDPVSLKELARNEEVYSYQNNRNPFIDYPELAEYIWGDLVGNRFQVPDSDIAIDAVLISPSQGTDLYFGEVQPGEESVLTLNVRGTKMKNKLVVWLYDINPADNFSQYFHLSSTDSIPTELINAEDGYSLEIKYSPAETGEHTAGILLYQGGLEVPVEVELNGVCTESSGITLVGAQSPDIYVAGNSIRFRTYSIKNAPVQIYNVYGNLLYANYGTGEWTEFVCKERGIYIVRINNKTQKVVIR